MQKDCFHHYKFLLEEIDMIGTDMLSKKKRKTLHQLYSFRISCIGVISRRNRPIVHYDEKGIVNLLIQFFPLLRN